MISIDGSYLEGGGQIVRTALALSAVTGKAFEISNIRKGRKDSGLKAQHVQGIKALGQVLNCNAKGDELGSSYLYFEPKQIRGKKINIDIGTAGSITLLLQAVLLPSFFLAEKFSINIKGGTNVAWSMPAEYLINVLLPQIRKFCAKIDVKITQRGYYPKGGGEMIVKLKNKYCIGNYSRFDEFLKEIQKEHKIRLAEQGKLEFIEGVSHASKNLQQREVAERQVKTAEMFLQKFGAPVKIRCEYADTLSTGSGITLWARFSGGDDGFVNSPQGSFSKTGDEGFVNSPQGSFSKTGDEFNPVILGADSLGERGKSAEQVGEECAKKLIKEIESGAACDAHLADNLIPWMGLFKPSKFITSAISNHTLTNIFVAEKFLGKCFEAKENLVYSR